MASLQEVPERRPSETHDPNFHHNRTKIAAFVRLIIGLETPIHRLTSHGCIGLLDFESDPRFGHLVEEASAAPWLDLPLSETLQPPIRCELVDGAMVLIDRSPGHVMNRVFCLG